MKADLAAWKKILDSTHGEDRVSLVKILTHWRADPDMAGMWNPGAPVAIPPAETRECRALLSDIDGLLKQLMKIK